MSLRSRLHDIGKSQSQHEADDIRREQASWGTPHNAPLQDRELAVVHGVVRSVTLPPVTSVPVFEAEVFDGTIAVRLVWIGRRRIPGVEPGVFLRVSGRVCMAEGVPTIRNPHYDILPAR